MKCAKSKKKVKWLIDKKFVNSIKYSLLKDKNPKVHLEVSNLLDHGDMKVGFKIFTFKMEENL